LFEFTAGDVGAEAVDPPVAVALKFVTAVVVLVWIEVATLVSGRVTGVPLDVVVNVAETWLWFDVPGAEVVMAVRVIVLPMRLTLLPLPVLTEGLSVRVVVPPPLRGTVCVMPAMLYSLGIGCPLVLRIGVM
jgi:hypothetical protein